MDVNVIVGFIGFIIVLECLVASIVLKHGNWYIYLPLLAIEIYVMIGG